MNENSFQVPGKITKQRIAKFKTTNAFCKYNCFVQKNQTVYTNIWSIGVYSLYTVSIITSLEG